MKKNFVLLASFAGALVSTYSFAGEDLISFETFSRDISLFEHRLRDADCTFKSAKLDDGSVIVTVTNEGATEEMTIGKDSKISFADSMPGYAYHRIYRVPGEGTLTLHYSETSSTDYTAVTISGSGGFVSCAYAAGYN